MSDASFAKLQESVNGSKDLGTTTALPAESESRLATSEQVGPTPGPWKAEDERAFLKMLGVESSDWAHIKRDEHTIGSAYCGSSFEENMRNAQLMAAAPDLLAACKDCMENRGDWGALMFAAIAKAEGRDA